VALLDSPVADRDVNALVATVNDFFHGNPGGPFMVFSPWPIADLVTLTASVVSLIAKRRRLAGSLIGGIAETQEMLDFCAEHAIVADIETIRMAQIEQAYERMLKNDVKYRFVIDMATLRDAA